MNADSTYSDADAEIPYPPFYYQAGGVLNVLIIVLTLALLFIIAPILAGFIGQIFGHDSDYGMTIGDVTVLALLSVPVAVLLYYRHQIASTVGSWQPLNLTNRVQIQTQTTTFRGEFQSMAFSAQVVLWLDSEEMHERLGERMADLEKLIQKSIVRGIKDTTGRLKKDELETFIVEDIRIPGVRKVKLTDMSFRPS